MSRLPRRQRVAAYAVIVREGQILLSRLAPMVTRDELWTLPGGGLDHGEDPRHAVIREIREETGLDAQVGALAQVYSAHVPSAWRDGVQVDNHALRIVYLGWVARDAPEPRVQEVDGSTVEAAWVPVADVLSGARPTVPMVREALADHTTTQRQRVAAYVLVRRAEPVASVLLTRLAPSAYDAGRWTLPGGGVEHGERPVDALVREVAEECGLACTAGPLIAVHDVHFSGVAPSGRYEDYHGIHLIFEATVPLGAVPRVVEIDGTTDAAAWVPVADIVDGELPVTDLVTHALGAVAVST